MYVKFYELMNSLSPFNGIFIHFLFYFFDLGILSNVH